MPEESKKSKGFASDVLTLVSGTGLAQIIAIAIAPILSRIYSPSDFGIFALFLSLSGILATISCLRYELSIMLPDSDEEANNQLGLSIFIALTFSIFLWIVFFIFKDTILEMFNVKELGNYLYVVPIFVLLQGLFSSFNYWNSRNKKFNIMSKARISSSISGATFQLSAGFAGYVSGISLILGSLMGKIISLFVLSSSVFKKDKHIFSNIKISKMYAGLMKYKKFLLIDTWSSLLNSLSWQLPVLLLTVFFSSTIVGFYSLGFRLLQLPMSFIGTSISQVFFQRATEAKVEGTLDVLVENVLRILVVIGMFPILVLTFVGSDIFGVVLGFQWTEAGVYVQILSIWGFIWFISSPLSTLYVVFEKQEFGLKYNIINIITRTLSLLIGGYMESVYIALGLFSVSGIFVYGYLCIKMLSYADVKKINAFRIIFSNFKLFLPAGVILTTLKLIQVNSYIMTAVATLLCLIYFLYMLKTDSQLQSLLSSKYGTSVPLKKK